MNNPKVKMYINAFIVGGIIGAVTQGIYTILVKIVPVNPYIDSVGLTLLTVALIGGILTAVGIHQKIDTIGGMGAAVPLSGFASGVTGMIIGERAKGKPVGKAIIDGIKLPMKLIGLVYFIAFIGAIIKRIIG